MADITTNTLKIGSNNLVLRDADAQAKVAVNTQDITSLKEDYSDILNSAYVTDTASGSIASFPDGADGVPVKSLTVNIEPVQSGSGDPSPDNVRPISGHTQAVVTRTGKNLFDSSLLSNVSSSIQYVTISLKANTQYTMSSTIPIQGGNTANLFFMLPSESASSGTNGVNVNRPVTLTTGADGKAKVGYRLGDNTASQYAAYHFQIELGNTATEYNAYSQPQTVTIDLDGTIYGGTLDVTTGEMVIDRWLETKTWGDVSGTTIENYIRKGFDLNFENVYPPKAEKPQLCNLAPYHADFSSDSLHFYCNGHSAIVFLPTGTASDTEIQISGELATPFTVQLTANEISTALGQNNIWNDCGDTEVEYRADTKLYIQKVLNA